MPRKHLLWQLYRSYLLITIVSLGAVSWYALRELRTFHLQQTIHDMQARAQLFKGYLGTQALEKNALHIDTLCKEMGAAASTRITVIHPDGTVIGDSDKDPQTMDNHGDRPEVIEALQGHTGWEVRRSDTLRQTMLYVALPLVREGKLDGVVRTSIPLDAFERALQSGYVQIAFGGILIAVLAGVVCLLVSRRLSQPLEEMKRGIMGFTQGDFTHRLPVPESEELGVLAEAMNEMAAQLDTRIQMITRQRNEQESIFSSMVEGVIAVDSEERVLLMNRAAEQILGCNMQAARGRFIQEVVRNLELQEFISTALHTKAPTEGDITWRGEEDRFFQARGTALRDTSGESIGAVVVLNEVTRLYKLERMRRDFVANVSHELRTPITSIRGFAETLLDETDLDINDGRRYLEIIVRQANRLNAIIEDLLALSRIEKQADQNDFQLGLCTLRDPLHCAIQSCQIQADEKGIDISLTCPEDLEAHLNPPLFEQAIVNLVVNAIKYSEPKTHVAVEAFAADDGIHVQVTDEGCGISREHCDRLFERFYRVDKARSRSQGGTGLGLAIVKHITQAHRGTVSVQSEPGKGSTFTLLLPLP